MLKTIASILQELNVHAYEICETKTRGWEFYFIRHELDQHRAKEVTEVKVKVLVTVDDGVGSASMVIPPTVSEEELKGLLVSLKERAKLVKNQPYTMRSAQFKAFDPAEKVDVAAISKDFIDVMNSIEETATEDINSYEIFVSEKTERLLTSEGIDVTQTYPSSMLEVVVNARKEGHEIELYRNYTSGSCDKAALLEDLMRTMQYGKDRLLTKPTPALGHYDVMFSTSDAVTIYGYFVEKLDVALVARKMSDYEIGTPIAKGIAGDKVTLRAVRELPNSSENRAYDREGAPIKDTVLMEESVPMHYVGGAMFSSYMDVNDTFMPSNLVVDGGSLTEEELRKGDYLELVEFSDFQVDPMTGDIFGEIRLGYLHQNGNVTVISGGSVSGSMDDFVKDMQFSKETVQYDEFRIPKVTLLKNVTITGIEE